ncbi:unnamed protein product [Phyllotreta striolata]|uniref:Rho GTPase-activating protein 21 n=1 Tax=Phyllotreta striolata TaxID=444603 RepID=A0A9N9TR77_PHYSR|nr:unnamed protein product [Phyllotreta striolata]
MDEHGGPSSNRPHPFRTQETFQRQQEAQVGHRFPNPTGIIPVPRGSKGPRSLFIRRYGDSFGFTLRHFIVYPPDSVAEQLDGRHAAVGALLTPMDTIFVKHVKEKSPAKQAGLQRGDRLVAVNGVIVKDKPYTQVVQLIVNSPEYLHLLVVPKEDDVLQRFFSDTAYNPASNQNALADIPQQPVDKRTAQQIIANRLAHVHELQVDAFSWHTLQHPFVAGGPRSAENLLQPVVPRRRNHRDQYYHQHHHQHHYEAAPHDTERTGWSRAAPQVPLYNKMGRRASEGNILCDSDRYVAEFHSLDPEEYGNMKTGYRNNNYNPDSGDYPKTANSNLNTKRRESTSSCSSVTADGSKDSLNSFGSNSTLTGQDTDDSVIMSRFRKSVQQKEAFLRQPANVKEFYGVPKKLEKQEWPPPPPPAAVERDRDSPSRNPRPSHQNVARIKQDIDNERDLRNKRNDRARGGAASDIPQPRGVTSPKGKDNNNSNVDRIYEASTAPAGYDCNDVMNGSVVDKAYYGTDGRVYSPPLQIVSRRAKEFESGKPLPDDDPVQSNRAGFSKSELARLSSKILRPNVTERAHEYETRTTEPRKDASSTSANSASSSVLKRIQRDSRSLDSSGSNASSASVNEVLFGSGSGKKLSGNVMISSGSKYLHCPPPSENGAVKPPPDIELTPRNRVRSNSVESTVGALADRWLKDNSNEKSEPDVKVTELRRSPSNPPYGDLPPLIPESVEYIHLNPVVTLTTPCSNKAIRPTQLDLDGVAKQPKQLTRTYCDGAPAVVKRRPKNTNSNIVDDEKTTRRESYLKATEGGRMHIDSDLSDSGDISPQAIRSAHRRWRPPLFPGDIQQLRKLFEDAAYSLGGSGSSSNASLDKEKISGGSSPAVDSKDAAVTIKEGNLNCKILEIDGKRSNDRSWKQATVILKGPKLYLKRDRHHHQSPVGTLDSLDQSLTDGVDMRTSVVTVAEDYTKRKNVFRVSVKPCRSEFLLQADSTEDFADWIKTLQDQVAGGAENESDPSSSIQRAVPQLTPASTTILVQGNHLSPQLNKQKPTASRNRSPTGQSPVSKSRKPSQLPNETSTLTSPKSKTWRGRMAKQFRKFNQGGNSPSSPTAPEGSTFGIPIEECIPSNRNVFLPRFVEVCTDIIDEKGLQTVGIYRVPGNNASITALADEVNRNYEDVPSTDPRWNDVHVVSSLLKSYFRKMTDSLITVQLYPSFIKADKIENHTERMEQLRKLLRCLPKHNYYTLKHIVEHLRRVADNCECNKMDSKNLAIVFGPTIVRSEEGNMQSMVNDMNSQYRIVETWLNHTKWFFPENENEENLPIPDSSLADCADEFDPNNQTLLLNNITKCGTLKDHKEKNGALLSSIISAARKKKIKKTTNKPQSSVQESKEDAVSPTNLKVFPSQSFSPVDLKECSLPDEKSPDIPTTVTDIEKKNSSNKDPFFKYTSDKDDFYRRIENFKKETESMLQLPRITEISVSNLDPRQFSSSSSTLNRNSRPSVSKPDVHHHLMKTHSATNVFSRASNVSEPNRNSLALMDSMRYSKNGDDFKFLRADDDDKQLKAASSDSACSDSVCNERTKCNIRRGGSIENVNLSSSDVSNGKKVRYENELQSENQRIGSLESLNKASNDDESLLSTMTKLIDERLKVDLPTILSGDGIPYVDDSPEKHAKKSNPDKENIPQASDLYRNPSLHKNQLKTSKKSEKEHKNDNEKELDTKERAPDNDRTATKTAALSNANGTNLRRSESLNRPERTGSPLGGNNKLKRSESLNKGDRLKRSDSLSKSEKTESNINRKREINLSNRRFKDNAAKNKRKTGQPDRSIKRRHTVGGTKDPDKITWAMDAKRRGKDVDKEPGERTSLRTSSPDLSAVRRDKFLFEINLIGPDNVVVALRQHLIGTRPQSSPDTSIFKVLESHV